MQNFKDSLLYTINFEIQKHCCIFFWKEMRAINMDLEAFFISGIISDIYRQLIWNSFEARPWMIYSNFSIERTENEI